VKDYSSVSLNAEVESCKNSINIELSLLILSTSFQHSSNSSTASTTSKQQSSPLLFSSQL